MLHIYYGDGKGKTTAAMGLVLRMLGAGKKVFIVQYLKGHSSGEIKALLAQPAVTVLRGKPGMKFTFQMTQDELAQVRQMQMRQLFLAFSALREGRAQLLVLDEALDAIYTNTLDEQTLIDLLKDCPADAEVVLTGRNPSKRLLEAADYVTWMQKEKHPYDRNVPAREGIEY